MTLSITTRIVDMYEQLGMTPAEIAEDMGMEVVAIKAGLLAHSKIYRSENREEIEERKAAGVLVTDDELMEFNDMYKMLARSTQDEYLKERTLRRLIDEAKGRNDITNVAKNSGNVNIVVLSDALTKAREAIARGRSGNKYIKDIETEKVA